MKQLFNGVAKEKFEEWALNNVKTHLVKKMKLKPNTMVWVFDNDFYKLPLSMQIGVIEDFAESLGYLIWQGKDESFDGKIWNFLEIEKDGEVLVNNHLETKQQLREEIIKELNNLINKN